MLVRRERTLLLVIAAVLFLAAILSVRQVLENQPRHAEMREAFILLAFEKGHTVDAQRLYDRLKYDLPEEPTRHLINDLERTATIAPTNESASSNILVRYHLSVRHEVEKRVQKRYLQERKESEPAS